MRKRKHWTSAEIRQSFLDFFAERGHTIVPSASLVPADDPTLLFTNAGMNQFKDVFLGIGTRPYKRAADTQKCMRVSGKHNDLEDVGRDTYHHTFFEMLGNWSFGDYYKKEAIGWAWELLTEVWGLEPERIWVSCFEDDKGDLGRDEEAAGYWRTETSIDPSHILFFGRKDNFWEMGETGPCGPCSEIHYDRGPEFCDRKDDPNHVCGVNADCGRFIELWNLVFIQYNRKEDGSLEPLPARHVDTGMGLERLVAIMQGVDSNYKTDLFLPIMDRVQEMLGHTDAERAEHVVGYRVIADHGRAVTFLIGDGVLPGNEGRNYVLRMILRRAVRFGRKIGFTEPFLDEVAKVVIEMMSPVFPELEKRREFILSVVRQEEERFLRTLDQGLARLDEVIEEIKGQGEKVIPGESAFHLYDTFGLPLEITRDVAEEHGLTVDEE
ncbi:MAG TPA: alanine--tRNA ligase, partial [Anaerolineae bacterium]|nr:alanine--tRNA ligase [Anaerolineae bacterium]